MIKYSSLLCLLTIYNLLFCEQNNKILRMRWSQEFLLDKLDIECSVTPVYTTVAHQNGKADADLMAVFFIPTITIDKLVWNDLAHVERQRSGVYKISCTYVKKPAPGITITVLSYNSNIKVEAVPFDPLDKKKGFSLTIFDKTKLDKLLQKTDKILHYACRMIIHEIPYLNRFMSL
jgi:hypothetical protein